MFESFEDYARESWRQFERRDDADRRSLVAPLKGRRFRRVLDVGCGGGQELVPFLEEAEAICVGVDIGPELGAIAREYFGGREKAAFARARGERLPFADESFDIVICRVALPYMDNRQALGEIARVLAFGGTLFLKTHSPWFYASMLGERARTLSLRLVAYPVICLAGSVFHSLTGRQLSAGFWRGKEIYQTKRFLEREFTRLGLRIVGTTADDNRLTPAFIVAKPMK